MKEEVCKQWKKVQASQRLQWMQLVVPPAKSGRVFLVVLLVLLVLVVLAVLAVLAVLVVLVFLLFLVALVVQAALGILVALMTLATLVAQAILEVLELQERQMLQLVFFHMRQDLVEMLRPLVEAQVTDCFNFVLFKRSPVTLAARGQAGHSLGGLPQAGGD
jgi:uncharacterized membrane protein